MNFIYYLQHSYEDGDYDIVTDIGVFSSFEKAQHVVDRLKNHPKFKEYPDCFYNSKYIIDEDNWAEGFFTY